MYLFALELACREGELLLGRVTDTNYRFHRYMLRQAQQTLNIALCRCAVSMLPVAHLGPAAAETK